MHALLEAIHEGLVPLVILALVATPVAAHIAEWKPWLRSLTIWAAAAGCAVYTVTVIALQGALSGWFLLSVYLIAALVAVVAGQLAASCAAVGAVLVGAPIRHAIATVRERLGERRVRIEEARQRRVERRDARLRRVRVAIYKRAEARRQAVEVVRAAEAAEHRVIEEAAQRELATHRDRRRSDLRFAFESLKLDVQTLLTEQVFADLLNDALAPTDAEEIDRRCDRLAGMLEALQLPTEPGFGDIERVALEYQERRKKLAQIDLPDRVKEKLQRWLNRQEAERIHQIISEGVL